MLSACGGGGGPEPADAYVGTWASCQTSSFSNVSVLTTWTISKASFDGGEIVVKQEGFNSGSATPCTGAALQLQTLRTAHFALRGTRQFNNSTWDRVEIASDGTVRSELFQVSADRLLTSADPTLAPQPQTTRDSDGLPAAFIPLALTKR